MEITKNLCTIIKKQQVFSCYNGWEIEKERVRSSIFSPFNSKDNQSLLLKGLLCIGAFVMRLVNVTSLSEGMVLHKPVIDHNGRALLQSGMMLNERLIQRLHQLEIPFVYIEDERTEDIEIQVGVPSALYQKAYEEVKQNFSYLQTTKQAKKVASLDRISYTLLGTIRSLISHLKESKEALSLLTNIMAFDEYLFRHSLNVTIYAIAVANELKLNTKEIEMIGLGALLHDLGKVMVPHEILSKRGKLTEKEFNEVKKHSEKGFEWLRSVHSIPFTVAHCAYQHHERLDGTGYPRQLKEGEIHDFAKIISIFDVFDALTTNRSYRNAMLPHEAIELLYAGCGTQFETKFVEVFKKTVALYPPGMPVILNDGRKGMVSRIKKQMSERPIVRILEEDGIEVSDPYSLDLSKHLSIMIESCELSTIGRGFKRE